MNVTGDAFFNRDRYWADHPIILRNAVLPTRPLKDAAARVLDMATKARGCAAFWAHPLTGKSSCILAIERVIRKQFPDAGIVSLEAVEHDGAGSEGRLLVSILKAIEFAHPIDPDLAGKRHQVKRSLLALSGEARRIFIIIDEAQEVTNAEYGWLKGVVNALSKLGVKVSIIQFGQSELKKRKEDLKRNGRSDLGVRFLKGLRQFRGLRSKTDLDVICEAIDSSSEYPLGSGWTYTRSLFPKAYAAEFRFASLAPVICEKINDLVPRSAISDGLSMSLVADFFGELCKLCRKNDAPCFAISDETIEKALKLALLD